MFRTKHGIYCWGEKSDRKIVRCNSEATDIGRFIFAMNLLLLFLLWARFCSFTKQFIGANEIDGLAERPASERAVLNVGK